MNLSSFFSIGDILFKVFSDTVKNIITKVKPIAKNFWEIFVKNIKKNRHNLEDSVMAAMQPKLAEDIETEIKQAQMLAELEVAIFDHAFNYFNPENNDMDITRENIIKYINDTDIGQHIESAFKLHGTKNTIDNSQKIMFIVEALCVDIMDYTNTNYTDEDIDTAIEKCLIKSKSDVMSESNNDTKYPESRGIGGPEKLIHDPLKDRWFIVNKNGKMTRITKPRKFGLPTRRKQIKAHKSRKQRPYSI